MALHDEKMINDRAEFFVELSQLLSVKFFFEEKFAMVNENAEISLKNQRNGKTFD